MRYNVIAEGRSAPWIEPQDLLEDARNVVLNRSIMLASFLPVHVWAIQDHPKRLWRFAQEWMKDPARLEIWTVRQSEKDWRELGCHNLALADYEQVVDQTSGWYGIMPTLMWTLLQCQKRGARQIRVLAADMIGSGSPFSPEMPWKEEETRDDRIRWEIERRGLWQIQTLFGERGIEVDHYQVQPKSHVQRA